MKKILILLLLFGKPLFGQTYIINGTVTDMSSKKKLSDVNISLSQEGKFLSSSKTDSLGKFSIEVQSKEKFKLTITCIGFKEFNVTTSYKNPVEIFLTPEIYNLEPISFNKWTESKYKFFAHCDTMVRISVRPDNIPNGPVELAPSHLGGIACWQYTLVKTVRASISKQTISNNIEIYFSIDQNGDLRNVHIVGNITETEQNLIANEIVKNKKWKCAIQNGKNASATFRQLIVP